MLVSSVPNLRHIASPFTFLGRYRSYCSKHDGRSRNHVLVHRDGKQSREIGSQKPTTVVLPASRHVYGISTDPQAARQTSGQALEWQEHKRTKASTHAHAAAPFQTSPIRQGVHKNESGVFAGSGHGYTKLQWSQLVLDERAKARAATARAHHGRQQQSPRGGQRPRTTRPSAGHQPARPSSASPGGRPHPGRPGSAASGGQSLSPQPPSTPVPSRPASRGGSRRTGASMRPQFVREVPQGHTVGHARVATSWMGQPSDGVQGLLGRTGPPITRPQGGHKAAAKAAYLHDEDQLPSEIVHMLRKLRCQVRMRWESKGDGRPLPAARLPTARGSRRRWLRKTGCRGGATGRARQQRAGGGRRAAWPRRRCGRCEVKRGRRGRGGRATCPGRLSGWLVTVRTTRSTRTCA